MQCRYYIPTLNLIGRGCVQEIGREARNLHGKRAFIVASTGPIGEGQADFVAAILEKEGLECVLRLSPVSLSLWHCQSRFLPQQR